MDEIILSPKFLIKSAAIALPLRIPYRLFPCLLSEVKPDNLFIFFPAVSEFAVFQLIGYLYKEYTIIYFRMVAKSSPNTDFDFSATYGSLPNTQIDIVNNESWKLLGEHYSVVVIEHFDFDTFFKDQDNHISESSNDEKMIVADPTVTPTFFFGCGI